MSVTAFQRMRREAAAKAALSRKGKSEKATTKELLDMTVDELKTYAGKHNIDIGKSTSYDGILEKIKKAQAE